MTASRGFTPLVTVVGFHHARGPEVEIWFGAENGHDPAADNEWSLLPFMALSDGAHTQVPPTSPESTHDPPHSMEDFSYFTLRQAATGTTAATSLFGISCTRQLNANQLIDRPTDVTRSTVQKAVVVITDGPQTFGQVREKLSMVTKAWFAQKDFTDMEILKKFQESLTYNLSDNEEDKDQYLGLSLRELIHDFKHQTLVLLKCCLLQPKMLFFGSRCERLCMMQFSLISLIPGLIRNLQDCADPEMDTYRENLVRPTSLKTSERNSLLSYMGLPLQIFGKGSLFGPYTPLQQLDLLADFGTKSYIVGSTNSLLLQQKDRYSDILINLDEESIHITSTALRTALALSVADRRWIDFLTQSVQDTWDDANPSRPKMMGYVGSEEFIRLQFEEYLLSLISSVKYHIFLQDKHSDPRALLSDVDSHLFDIVEPRHPCAGGLTIEDVQRRLAQQVSELHLDERFHTGKEVLGKHLATSQKKVSSAFKEIWADIEVMREAQRKRHEERQAAAEAEGGGAAEKSSSSSSRAQASMNAASSRAGAYISSWTSWAGEKRKGGWSTGGSSSIAQSPSASPSMGASPRFSRPNLSTSTSAPALSPHPTRLPTSTTTPTTGTGTGTGTGSGTGTTRLKRRSGQLSPKGDGEFGLMPLTLGSKTIREDREGGGGGKEGTEEKKTMQRDDDMIGPVRATTAPTSETETEMETAKEEEPEEEMKRDKAEVEAEGNEKGASKIDTTA
ncbi:MAG: late secretory pathway protein avl9 [Thelocarpon superellum]|nr:MAG: late secretory pathway protein avl9 [Thelocarpon superellum]